MMGINTEHIPCDAVNGSADHRHCFEQCCKELQVSLQVDYPITPSLVQYPQFTWRDSGVIFL